MFKCFRFLLMAWRLKRALKAKYRAPSQVGNEGYCTRTPWHKPPCNGFPCRTCPGYEAWLFRQSND